MKFVKARPESEPAGAPRPTERSDDEICRALVAGDTRAAEALYDKVASVVDAVLYRLLGADAEREDLAQQTIERVITTVLSGRFARECSLKSWSTLLAQHVAVDALRARARERRLFDRSAPRQALELVAASTQTPEHLAATRRRVELLQSALARVTKERSEAVVLHDVLGHDLVEIAKITGVSVAAAQSRLSRGRREILEWIRSHEERE